MVEQSQSTHKMRMDLANTLIPDLDLYDAAFTRHGLHYLYLLVASITREINMVEQRQTHSKDAHGPGEHAQTRFGPL